MENRAMKMYFAPRTLARLNHLYISRTGFALTVNARKAGEME